MRNKSNTLMKIEFRIPHFCYLPKVIQEELLKSAEGILMNGGVAEVRRFGATLTFNSIESLRKYLSETCKA